MDEAKRELVRSWLQKAANDLAAAQLLSRSQPVLGDIAVYHCQQAAEKSLKALLASHDRRLQKTHDVRLLVDEAMKLDHQFETLRDPAVRLTPYATAFRYPGVIDLPSTSELDQALEDAQLVHQCIISFLPPDVALPGSTE